SERRRPAQRSLAMTPNPDRRVRLLHRLGFAAQVRKMLIASLEMRFLFRPQHLHRPQVLVSLRTPFMIRSVEEGKLLSHPPHACPEDHPSTGKHVEGSHHFGRDYGGTVR